MIETMTKQQDIETVVDRLLDYVRANGQVNAKQAAKALGLKVAQVEKIALLLEDSNLLEVQYGFSGVILDSRPPKKRENSFQAESSSSSSISNSSSSLKEKKKTTNQNSSVYSSLPDTKGQDEVDTELLKLQREVLTADNLINFFERDITRRTIQIESLITDLERRNDYTEEELVRAKKEMVTALSQLESFQTEINKLTKRQIHLHSKIIEFSMRLKSLRATVNPIPNSKNRKGFGILSKVTNMLKSFISDLKRSVDGSDEPINFHPSFPITNSSVSVKKEEQMLSRARELASLYNSNSQENSIITNQENKQSDEEHGNKQPKEESEDSVNIKKISKLKSNSVTAYDQLRNRSKPK